MDQSVCVHVSVCLNIYPDSCVCAFEIQYESEFALIYATVVVCSCVHVDGCVKLFILSQYISLLKCNCMCKYVCVVNTIFCISETFC